MIFNAELIQIKGWTIIRLPQYISKELPSRGMVMVEATINNVIFNVPLEPDGMGSHWFRMSAALCNEIGLKVGETVPISVKPIQSWSEPEVPEDLSSALSFFKVESQWKTLTTKARWEWIRWIRFTHNPETRQKRIKTACSMLESGKKRPCCFDHSRCTEPFVSKNGILVTEPPE